MIYGMGGCGGDGVWGGRLGRRWCVGWEAGEEMVCGVGGWGGAVVGYGMGGWGGGWWEMGWEAGEEDGRMVVCMGQEARREYRYLPCPSSLYLCRTFQSLLEKNKESVENIAKSFIDHVSSIPYIYVHIDLGTISWYT